ncbi:MAG: type II toxin-antitoxin system VapC family toxin [Marmoricola sp.]
MILVDTSVWIDHLHRAEGRLIELLDNGRVATHPMVIGELRLGTLQNREEFLTELSRLPRFSAATDLEVAHVVEHRRLWGRGLSLVDAHLLAAALLQPDGKLWTRDRRLDVAAAELGVSAS